jgi:predicted dehydrogenase
MNVAIIGLGLIGQKRAKSLGNARLAACVDLIPEKAERLSKQFENCTAHTDWHDVMCRSDIDIVIVATLHASLSEIAIEAVKAGKHVLIEKPAGRRAHELESLLSASQNGKTRIRVGFNHRYHPAFRKARELVDQNALGELMFIRGRYGHGGRVGYEKEWRANPSLSGGGELIDQGIHLIDLARWFLGDFTDIQGHAHTYYWDMPVDDNGFLLLKTAKKQTAFLHASCTEWKNLFSFEIYGKKGKIDIHGLGGSYGVERIAFYQMRPEMGPPETAMWEYPMPDDSFAVEFAEFLEDIQKSRQPNANIHDAHAALTIVEEIYRMSNL